MGYYTRFKMKTNPPEAMVDVESYLDELEESEKSWYLLSNFARGNVDKDGWLHASNEMKWYKHHEDMLELSTHFPNVVLVLQGVGEKAGDMWVAYYRNGQGYRAEAKITFDEFDPDKLQ